MRIRDRRFKGRRRLSDHRGQLSDDHNITASNARRLLLLLLAAAAAAAAVTILMERR
jgi:hypothetical protein